METIRTVRLKSWVPFERKSPSPEDQRLGGGDDGPKANLRTQVPVSKSAMKRIAIPMIFFRDHGEGCSESECLEKPSAMPESRPSSSSTSRGWYGLLYLVPKGSAEDMGGLQK
jgi:hypothetical protein